MMTLRHSSVGALQAHIKATLAPVASQYNLSVDAFGELPEDGDATSAYGRLVLSDAYNTALEPAPITPTTGSGPWQLLSGTIRSSLGTSQRALYQDKKPFVSPSISLGTRYVLCTYERVTDMIAVLQEILVRGLLM